jgi:uncharacterized membrane protein
MKSVTKEKYLVLILSSIIYGVGMFLYPNIINTISIFYVGIIGSFLGIDMATTLKRTNSMPEGNFKPIKKDRYIVCAIITTIFFITSLILNKLYDIQIESGLTTLGATIFIIATMYIASLEANKLLTGDTKVGTLDKESDTLDNESISKEGKEKIYG